MAILTSRNLSKRFGGLIALRELDLTIQPLSIHTFLGVISRKQTGSS